MIISFKKSFKSNSIINIEQGNKDREILFLIEGTVGIMSKDEKWILKKYEAGSYFGLISLFKWTKKECSLVALTNCLVGVLTINKFEELLKNHPIMESRIKINGNLEDIYIAYIILAFKIALIMGLDQTVIRNLQILDSESFNLELVNQINEKKRKKQKMQTENIDRIINNESKINERKLLSSPFGRGKKFESSLYFFDYQNDELTEIDKKDEQIKLIEDNIEIKNNLKSKHKLQRRYSQITNGKTLSLAKNSGMKIKWGINISQSG